VNRAIEVAFLREIDRTRGEHVNPRNRVERGDRLRPVFQACGGPRALDRTWSNGAGSPAANDHRNPSINEPGAKMSAKTGTVSVLARFMLPQIARKSAQTVRLLLRGRERIGRRTVISTVRRRQRNSTVAELAEMNMTEGNKNLQGQRKTRQPRYCRPLRPVRFDLNHLMKYGLGFDSESTFVSHIPYTACLLCDSLGRRCQKSSVCEGFRTPAVTNVSTSDAVESGARPPPRPCRESGQGRWRSP